MRWYGCTVQRPTCMKNRTFTRCTDDMPTPEEKLSLDDFAPIPYEYQGYLASCPPPFCLAVPIDHVGARPHMQK